MSQEDYTECCSLSIGVIYEDEHGNFHVIYNPVVPDSITVDYDYPVDEMNDKCLLREIYEMQKQVDTSSWQELKIPYEEYEDPEIYIEYLGSIFLKMQAIISHSTK